MSGTALMTVEDSTSTVGTRLAVQGTAGAAHTVEQGIGAGEDINANTQRISDDGTSVYISTATTTLIATGRGVLKRIVLGETAAGTITVYDNITATGTVLAVLKASIAEQTYEIGANFSVGCTIVTAGASKLTAIVGR